MSNSTLSGTLSIVNYSITKQGYVNGFLCKTSKKYPLYVKKYSGYIKYKGYMELLLTDVKRCTF